jgi:lipid II:glycine glycyltransferase (peptidoglycan interpeptide bridge formation enzyme)
VDVRVIPKSVSTLQATRLVQQTSLWSHIKRRLGWSVAAFDIEADHQASGDVLVLSRGIGGGTSMAYSPFGPEKLPDSERRGEYLAALSSELAPHLGSSCLFVRWDLPWASPYSESREHYDDNGFWLGPPETRIRELRMNWGVERVGLRKSPTDILPPDTILVDLHKDQDLVLSRMKAKTRYNIRLAAKKGVRVRAGDVADMELWKKLYRETSRRNGIVHHDPRFFQALFAGKGSDSSVRLLVAEKGDIPLAAMFLSISADRATYLYGASSGENRHLMASYALQWEVMRLAIQMGCTSYDLFGVAPRPDPEHPMYGLYQFKSGFGGRFLHRQGAWDYPYHEKAYSQCIANESIAAGFHSG